MSIHIEGKIPDELGTRFHAIAARENIDRDHLLANAVAAFVADYEWRKAVEAGLEDVRRGRTAQHAQVMEELDAIIEAAAAGKAGP